MNENKKIEKIKQNMKEISNAIEKIEKKQYKNQWELIDVLTISNKKGINTIQIFQNKITNKYTFNRVYNGVEEVKNDYPCNNGYTWEELQKVMLIGVF